MDIAALLSSVPTGLWIGGEERAGQSTFEVLNPATEDVIARVADATPQDGIAALDAAAAVEKEWAATPARERGEILRSVFETITARAEDVATLMTLEMGKVLAESRGEVKYGAEFFRWFAEEAVRIGGRYTPSPAGTGPAAASWFRSRPPHRATTSAASADIRMAPGSAGTRAAASLPDA